LSKSSLPRWPQGLLPLRALSGRRLVEMSNNIMEVNASEEIYKYDRAQQQSMLAAKPWEKDPHFFKEIKISGFRIIFK
jgi:hypothetical protein